MLYVNGCDQIYFERQIEKYLVIRGSLTCLQVQEEFHQFYKAKGGANAVVNTSPATSLNTGEALAATAAAAAEVFQATSAYMQRSCHTC